MLSSTRTVCLRILLVGTGLCSCNRSAPPREPAAATATSAPAAPSAPVPLHAPMSRSELPTTDGQIAMANLVGSLHTSEGLMKARGYDPSAMATVVKLLCAVAHYRGTLADYDQAAQVVEQMFKLAPQSPHSYLARAKLRSIFHEFDQALADLAQAEKLDPETAQLVYDGRAGIFTALGKSDEALAMYKQINARRPDTSTMGLLAGLLADRGELAVADDLFMKAQLRFGDVAPFPIAWLYFQHGLMWEQAGNLPRARELYAAAVDRLPTYAPAIAHLAAAEAARANRDHAIALLRPLVTESDDPEYKGQLAGLLKEAGDIQGADALRTQARSQYESLLAKHPRAFASHAARFYLGAGADPQAALGWAEKNLVTAVTNDSLALLIEAATAAGASARACALADQLTKRPYVSARLHVITSRAFTACGQRERAAAEVATAAKQSAR